MATHIHEQEQVEALKRWWKENGTSVIAGIALGVAGIFGWNAWKTYQQTQAEQASDLYMQLHSAIAEGKYDLAEGIASRITSDFERTAYADFARLMLAKAAADQGQMEAAKRSLESILTGSKDEDFKHIARIRLALILLVLGKPEEGIALLTAPEVGDPGRFAGQYEEVKGDLYLAWGKPKQALDAYRKAIALGRDHLYLQMKLNELGPNSS